MEKLLIDGLLAVASEYGARAGLKPTAIALAAAKDRSFFAAIDAGRSITLRKLEEVLQWFSDNWPEDAQWPSSIERPVATPAAEQAVA